MELIVIIIVALALGGSCEGLTIFRKRDNRTLMQQYEDRLRAEGKIK